MRILFVTDYFYPHIGGVEKLFLTLCRELVQSGHEVTYITWKYDKSLAAKEEFEGINIYRVSAPTRMLFPFWAFRKINKHAKTANIIHTSTYSSALGAYIGAKFTTTKIVVTVHEVWKNLWMKLPFLTILQKSLFSLLERFMFSLKFDHYIAVSDNTMKELQLMKIEHEKITRIYNGVDELIPTWTKPEGHFTFTYFGRAGVSKGLDLLVKAAEELSTIYPEVKFKFILSPQNPKVLNFVKKHIKSKHLASTSHLMSNLSYDQLKSELLASSCIIIPSYSEGFGFTAVEACSLGIPIISSEQGSLPEVVFGKVIGMDHFSVEGLIQAMEKAINNDYENRVKKEFPIDDFIQNHIKLYQSIINN